MLKSFPEHLWKGRCVENPFHMEYTPQWRLTPPKSSSSRCTKNNGITHTFTPIHKVKPVHHPSAPWQEKEQLRRVPGGTCLALVFSQVGSEQQNDLELTEPSRAAHHVQGACHPPLLQHKIMCEPCQKADLRCTRAHSHLKDKETEINKGRSFVFMSTTPKTAGLSLSSI